MDKPIFILKDLFELTTNNTTIFFLLSYTQLRIERERERERENVKREGDLGHILVCGGGAELGGESLQHSRRDRGDGV